MDNLQDRICTLVAATFQVPRESVTLDSSSTSIENWDSVNLLQLLFAIEAEFEITVPPDDIPELQSVRGIETVVQRQIQNP